ncbi:hypothetical protein CTZ27_27095 [Streptomyces griseocarneus]|nr:hypothetical protein CTZ27_27095 [Streptomyces griseocarneus]
MLTPPPIGMPKTYYAAPVVTVPHSSAIGSINYVTCQTCRDLIAARDKCRARSDVAGVKRIEADQAAHCAKRHVRARGW